MSQFECGDNAALVSYLYDECDPAERGAIEAHLGVCPACAAELAAMASTSMQLAAWTPPEPGFDFRIVSESRTPAPVLKPARWWRQPLPAWAQAAAATVIFGAGLGLGVLSGTTAAPPAVSAPMASSAPVPPAASAPVPAAAPTVSPADLAALERRLRTEMSQLRAGPQAVTARAEAAPAVAASEARLLARVRALIDESEQRQRRELALRTAEVVRDVEAQRQFDFARIQRAFGQFEGTAGAEIQRQRQELNQLIRVSQRPR
jgi:anti-sigma factor RsiW